MSVLLTTVTGSVAEKADARELVVDRKNGPYVTLQAALEEARPGDTVLVNGGVFSGYAVTRRNGTSESPITIRAVANREALFTAGRELAGAGQPVPEHPTLLSWQLSADTAPASDPQATLWEAGSRLCLKRVFTLDECGQRFGSWYYDAATAQLYLHSSGTAPAGNPGYLWANGRNPVLAINHHHIIVEGLQFAFGQHGISINTDYATIRHCRTWCNRSAGIYLQGNHHLIERNQSSHNNRYGIQLRHGVNNCHILHNLAWHNGPNGGEVTDTSLPAEISMYSRGAYNLFEGNILDGLHQNTFRIKMGGNAVNVVRHNVNKGFFDCAAPYIEHNTILANGLGPRFGIYVNRSKPDINPDPARTDPLGLQRRSNLIHPVIHRADPRFADPAWRDYRLQADSPWRELGAFPASATVLYCDQQAGDDAHDGRSVAQAVRTLKRAIALLRTGETLYLLPGTYSEELRLIMGGLSRNEPTTIRPWGKTSDVVLTGGVVLERGTSADVASVNDDIFVTVGPQHIRLEGLTFKERGVQLKHASGITLSHCVWDVTGSAVVAQECSGLRLDHATIAVADSGITLRNCRHTTISRSLLSGAEAVLDIDGASQESLQTYYNAYNRATWHVAGEKLTSLAAWQAANDAETGGISTSLTLEDDYTLPAASELLEAADDYTALGARTATAAGKLEILKLRVAGLAPGNATLLWEMTQGGTESHVMVRGLDDDFEQEITPVSIFQIWGEYFDMSFRSEAFFTAARHAPVAGLQPGRRYEATVTSTTVDGSRSSSQKIDFTTPAEFAAPRTFHVAPTGDDTAAGTSPATAWRTLRHATLQVAPGDTVRIESGRYFETLRPCISGSAGRPIRFESSEPRGAVIDFQESLPSAFELFDVDHVEIDGLAFANGKFLVGHLGRIAQASDIKVSGCQVLYPPKYSFEKLGIGHAGIVAVDAPRLHIENNAFVCCEYPVGLSRCPGTKILHNTFVGEGNYGVALVPESLDEDYTIRNNLFYRVIGRKTNGVIWMFNLRCRLDSDYNLFYTPDDYPSTIGSLADPEVRHKSLAEWQTATGLDQNSLEGLPLFIDPQQGDFRLQDSSPGRHAAADGGPVGLRH